MPFIYTLTLIFVVAKIVGYITWSWWLVFLPLYGSLAIGLVLLSIVAFVANGKIVVRKKNG